MRLISNKALLGIALGIACMVPVGCIARPKPRAIEWTLSKEATRQAWELNREQRTGSRANRTAGDLWAAVVVCWEAAQCEGVHIDGEVTERTLTGVATEFLDANGRMYSRFDGLSSESYSLDVVEAVLTELGVLGSAEK